MHDQYATIRKIAMSFKTGYLRKTRESLLFVRPLFVPRKLLILLVARDGIEPPTPAFSGPPSKRTKWSGISGCV